MQNTISSCYTLHDHLIETKSKIGNTPLYCCLVYLGGLSESVRHFGYPYVLEIESEYIEFVRAALPADSTFFRIEIGFYISLSTNLNSLKAAAKRIGVMSFIPGRKSGDLGLNISISAHAVLSEDEITIENIDSTINALSLGVAFPGHTKESSTNSIGKNQSIARALLDSNLEKEFEVVIQPVVRLHDRVVSSGEALLRWHSPALGNLYPADFIPIAEDLNLIDEMTFFVLRNIGKLLATLGTSNKAKIAINLSPKSIVKPDFRKRFIDQLKNSTFNKSLLTVEITERQFLGLDLDIKAFFENLKDLGIYLSIDDFGDGAASMNYLRLFPIECLKISGELAYLFESKSSSDLSWLRGVVDMAHQMSAKVIVEGLDTNTQLDTAISLGVDYIQGYIFFKSMNLAEFANLLKP